MLIQAYLDGLQHAFDERLRGSTYLKRKNVEKRDKKDPCSGLHSWNYQIRYESMLRQWI